MRRFGLEPKEEDRVPVGDFARGTDESRACVGVGMGMAAAVAAEVDGSPGFAAARCSSSCWRRSLSLLGAWSERMTTLLGKGCLEGLDGRDSSQDA